MVIIVKGLHIIQNHNCDWAHKTRHSYHKQQKLCGRKVLRFAGFYCDVEKPFAVLCLPITKITFVHILACCYLFLGNASGNYSG